MASSKATSLSKVFTKKKGKTNNKLSWADQDTDIFAEVIFDPQYRGIDYTVGWATVLEHLALKKSSNVIEDIWGNSKSVTRVTRNDLYVDKLFVKILLRIYT